MHALLFFILTMLLVPSEVPAKVLTSEDCARISKYVGKLKPAGDQPTTDSKGPSVSVTIPTEQAIANDSWRLSHPTEAAKYDAAIKEEATKMGLNYKSKNAEDGFVLEDFKDGSGTSFSKPALHAIMQQLMDKNLFNPYNFVPSNSANIASGELVAFGVNGQAYWYRKGPRMGDRCITQGVVGSFDPSYPCAWGDNSVFIIVLESMPPSGYNRCASSGLIPGQVYRFDKSVPASGYESWDASKENGAKYFDTSREDFDPEYLNKALQKMHSEGLAKMQAAGNRNVSEAQAMADCARFDITVDAVSPDPAPGNKDYIIDDKGKIHYVPKSTADTFRSADNPVDVTPPKATIRDPSGGGSFRVPDGVNTQGIPQGAEIVSASGSGVVTYIDPADGQVKQVANDKLAQTVRSVQGPDGGVAGGGNTNGFGGSGTAPNYTDSGIPLNGSGDAVAVDGNGSGSSGEGEGEDDTFTPPGTDWGSTSQEQFSTADAQDAVNDKRASQKEAGEYIDSLMSLFPFVNLLQGVQVSAGGSDTIGTLQGSVGGAHFSQDISMGPVAGALSMLGEILFFFCSLYALRMAMTKR